MTYRKKWKETKFIKKKPREKRNSPVCKGHALEQLVQRSLNAELLRSFVVRRTAGEFLLQKSCRSDNRDPGSFLVGNWDSEFILVVLGLRFEVGHHKVARMYGLAGILAAILLPSRTMKTLARCRGHHCQRLSVYQFGLHPSLAPLCGSQSCRYVFSHLPFFFFFKFNFFLNLSSFSAWIVHIWFVFDHRTDLSVKKYWGMLLEIRLQQEGISNIYIPFVEKEKKKVQVSYLQNCKTFITRKHYLIMNLIHFVLFLFNQ